DKFEPGERDEGDVDKPEEPELSIKAATLIDRNNIRVSYSHRLTEQPQSLGLALRTLRELQPRKTLGLPVKSDATWDVVLPENTLADSYGAVRASLVADLGDRRVESVPVWIVQEENLTYEPSEGSSSSKSRIEETGEGLLEYLDELGKRRGISAVIEYLQKANIQFHDSGGGIVDKRRFRVRMTDPFHSDTKPDWLINAKDEKGNLTKAIYDFVDRHYKQKLRKHASRGNINSIENFLDIFIALIRLLYMYYKKGAVKQGRFIGFACELLEVATSGKSTKKDLFEPAFEEKKKDDSYKGYLISLLNSLHDDIELLQEVCHETNYCAEVRAVLILAQNVPFMLHEQKHDGQITIHPNQTLPARAKMIAGAFAKCGLEEPTSEDVRKALESYHMFSHKEIEDLIFEM
ncbi:MAG: hypothetical protein U9N87_04940, partial [Planctomycetota bacterium]|nr:hypothetical protein [Planctomycetota bacterium]